MKDYKHPLENDPYHDENMKALSTPYSYYHNLHDGSITLEKDEKKAQKSSKPDDITQKKVETTFSGRTRIASLYNSHD